MSHIVIASVAKQSRAACSTLDCFSRAKREFILSACKAVEGGCHLPIASRQGGFFAYAAATSSFLPSPPQSMLRVMYITPASAKNISTDPISNEYASRLSST